MKARDHKGPSSDGADDGLPLIPVAHALRGEGFDASEDGTGRGTPLVPIAIEERAVSENPNAGPNGAGIRTDGAAYTLEARTVTQAVAFSVRADAMREGTAKTMSPDAEGRMRLRDPGLGIYEEIAPTLDTGQAHGIVQPWAVRRLTPLECERLMGFPDGWTRIPYRNKTADACPDGPRYKALGNSWAVNCGRVIFDRMRMVEERWPVERMEAAE
jgi:DNA (cytosine-5)-methyltransferase 1